MRLRRIHGVPCALGVLFVAACNLPTEPATPAASLVGGSAAAQAGAPLAPPAAPVESAAIPTASPDVVITRLTHQDGVDETAPSPSPDGSLLLFVSQAHPGAKGPGSTAAPKAKAAPKGAQAAPRPVVMSIDPKRPDRATALTPSDARAVDPTFMPSGGGSVYVSEKASGSGLVRVDALGPSAAAKPVGGTNVVSPRHPSVSPDGSAVAFTMKKGAADVVATMRLDGKNLTVLGPGVAPAFAPDGSRIAFLRQVGGRAQLFTMETATGRATQLTSGDGDAQSLAWSPDGSRIAFVSTRGGKVRNVFVVKTDGTELRPLTASAKGDIRDLAWGKSSEGAEGVLYFAADATGSGDLDLYRLAFAAKGGAAPKAAIGKACSDAASCESGVCVAREGTTFCSRPCETISQCPAFYDCEPVSNASGKYCSPRARREWAFQD